MSDDNIEVVESPNGTKHWYKENKLHREDGPAVEFPNGTKWWYKEGKLHREDGPAIDHANGDKEYYYEGKRIECSSTKEFMKLISLKAFW